MGGRKIDDRSSWISQNGMDPGGVKKKDVMGASGAGELKSYEDTNEKIVAAQKAGVRNIDAQKMKEHYRN